MSPDPTRYEFQTFWLTAEELQQAAQVQWDERVKAETKLEAERTLRLQLLEDVEDLRGSIRDYVAESLRWRTNWLKAAARCKELEAELARRSVLLSYLGRFTK